MSRRYCHFSSDASKFTPAKCIPVRTSTAILREAGHLVYNPKSCIITYIFLVSSPISPVLVGIVSGEPFANAVYLFCRTPAMGKDHYLSLTLCLLFMAPLVWTRKNQQAIITETTLQERGSCIALRTEDRSRITQLENSLEDKLEANDRLEAKISICRNARNNYHALTDTYRQRIVQLHDRVDNLTRNTEACNTLRIAGEREWRNQMVQLKQSREDLFEKGSLLAYTT